MEINEDVVEALFVDTTVLSTIDDLK